MGKLSLSTLIIFLIKTCDDEVMIIDSEKEEEDLADLELKVLDKSKSHIIVSLQSLKARPH